MIDPKFVFLALCFNVLGSAVYLRSALQNKIRPHLVTWFLWAVAPYLAFAAQMQEGVGLVSLVTLIAGINPTIIFLATLRSRDAHWSVSAFDLTCGALSIAGLVLWITYRQAGFAVTLAILSDALASAPTFKKSLSDPQSESWSVYGCLSVSSLITLATIDDWKFANYGFVGYLAVLGTSLTMIVLMGSRLRRRGRET
ncbi:hypothetical protein Skr01_54150 [Sphaerisporangium krabiense]|uniref:PQ-loop repeat-containing protein n=1 Tax=Sphaerisporangium krabiense TaxID=763782 RepID=A0A7W9DQL6_9ACTN|nr:hypothetical protein [Sphaerisporangium krabiense]MBB5627174.1 hypothetical protein [Sphaerisporangium krabiense]GII65330.1 hypothetical protein Skr01_54150 [Sphaerisporangium krabiense]